LFFSSTIRWKKAVNAVLQRLGAESWGHSAFDLFSSLSGRIEFGGELLDYALELDNTYISTVIPMHIHPPPLREDIHEGS